MTSFRTVVIAGLVALLGACGKTPESTQPPAPAAPASQPAAEAPAAPAASPAGTAPAMPAAPVAESAGTEQAAPAGVAREIALPPAAKPAAARTSWQYTEPAHYRTLTTAEGTSSAPDKIEVAEVFWYGCPHCFDLDPLLSNWVKKLPADVTFVRIPVMWSTPYESHARMFYAAQALNKLTAMHPAIFRAIHIDNKPLTEEADIQKFFEQFGVSAKDFNKTFHSFAVDSQMQRAKNLTLRYKVTSVPLMVVNGKYAADGTAVHSHEDMLAVVDELIQRERQRN